jgi:hypothetical protein
MKQLISLWGFVLIFVLLISTACTKLIQTDQPYKTLALSKATAEEIVSTAKAMNKNCQLSDVDLSKIKVLYERARKLNDLIIDSMITALNLGIDPRTTADYNQTIEQFSTVLRDLYNLAIEFKIVKQEVK